MIDVTEIAALGIGLDRTNQQVGIYLFQTHWDWVDIGRNHQTGIVAAVFGEYLNLAQYLALGT